jgi:hypothetical protein
VKVFLIPSSFNEKGWHKTFILIMKVIVLIELKVVDTLTKYFSLNHLPKLCNIFNYNLKCKFEASKQS